MNFKEIKKLNKLFNILNSFSEFYDYLKTLSDKEKLNIKKYKDKISLIIFLEVLLKQETVEINLFLGQQDIDLNMKIISKELLKIKGNEIYKINEELNKEVINLKNKNEELIKEINDLNSKLEKKINNIKKEDNKNNEEQNQKIKKEFNKRFSDINK